MPDNSTELQWAAFQGELNKVRSLIEAGADPNSAGDCGTGTLLNFHPQVTAYLLANGRLLIHRPTKTERRYWRGCVTSTKSTA